MTPINTNIHEDCWALMTETYLERFRGYQLEPLALDDVKVNPDGQYGGGITKTKAQVIKENYPMIKAYFENPESFPPPVWTTSGKKEHLPTQSILGKLKQRTITYPPGHFSIVASSYIDPRTDLFLELEKTDPTGCCYTESIFHGGFHKMMMPIEKFDYKFKGDLEGYDRSHIFRFWQNYVASCRLLYKPEHHKRIEFLFYNYYYALVAMPDGDVVLLTRHKSGGPGTTDINCDVHHQAFIYLFYRRLKEHLGRDLTMADRVSNRQIWNTARMLYYADDNTGSTNDQRFASYEFRSMAYAELGLKLKREDDLVVYSPGRIPECLTFLGNSPRLIDNRYVPVGNGIKYRGVFMCQGPNSNNTQKAAQLFSYMLMTCFDDEFYYGFRDAFFRLHLQSEIQLPERWQMQRFVAGGESFFSLPPLFTEIALLACEKFGTANAYRRQGY